MTTNLTLTEAIDHLSSANLDGRYNLSRTTKEAIRIVLEELNKASGEIVTLREQVNQHMTSLNELGKFSTSMIKALQEKLDRAEHSEAMLMETLRVAQST